MKAKRLWWTIRLILTRGGRKRADYARKQHIYAHIGKNVSIQSRVVPVYSELISFHDNIAVARNVDFVTHDIMHSVFNRLPEEERKLFIFGERIGCIEVMDNVFIGSNSVILYNVKIGSNVVIASGSVVTKDCEPNSVYAGVPARKVGSFDALVQKRICGEHDRTIAITRNNQNLTEKEITEAWNIFNKLQG
jgi:Acetyltransferase (isoleucine patch superfamily)